MDAYAVTVRCPGRPDRSFGPVHFEHVARGAAHHLERMTPGSAKPPGITIATGPYDPTLPHESIPPLGTYALADLIDAEPAGDGLGTNFPDLYDRLHAFYTDDAASRAWGRASNLLAAREADEEAQQ